jgi:hypothetical protein
MFDVFFALDIFLLSCCPYAPFEYKFPKRNVLGTGSRHALGAMVEVLYAFS